MLGRVRKGLLMGDGMGVVGYCGCPRLGWIFSRRAQRVRSLHVQGVDGMPGGMDEDRLLPS